MIDILDVLCFFICGLFEVRSSPNLLQINVVSVKYVVEVFFISFK